MQLEDGFVRLGDDCSILKMDTSFVTAQMRGFRERVVGRLPQYSPQLHILAEYSGGNSRMKARGAAGGAGGGFAFKGGKDSTSTDPGGQVVRQVWVQRR